MHCYEYLAMHLQLKSELKREYPNQDFDHIELDALLGSLGVNSFQQLQTKIESLHMLNTLNLNSAQTLKLDS